MKRILKKHKNSYPNTTKVNNLLIRSLTGFFFIVVVIGSILIGRLAFSVVFFGFNILTLYEYYKLLKRNTVSANKPIIGIAGGSGLYVIASLVSNELIGKEWLLLTLLVPIIITVVEIFMNRDKPENNIALTLSGIIYISIPFSVLTFFYNPAFIQGGSHPNILLGFFLILWTYDTFAYLVGMSIGKHKFFKRISPNKTWEGTIGGFVFGMAVSWVLSLFFVEYNLFNWLLIGFITVLFGTFGDLAESMLKRSSNVKDSGKMLPGHGGFLDRFDATLLAAPAVFIFLVIVI